MLSALQAGAVRGRATSADDATAAAVAVFPLRLGFVVANSKKQVKLFSLYSLSFQYALCLGF